MEKENPSPYSAPPAEFFAREMERLRALPPRFVHVESYIEACLTQWEALYPNLPVWTPRPGAWATRCSTKCCAR